MAKLDKMDITFGVELKRCSGCEALRASQRNVARWGYRAPRISHFSVAQEMCCSACGTAFPRRDGDRWYFCPHCGARMEGLGV